MKRPGKKWLPLALALVLLLGLLPTAALAADSGFTVEGGVLTKYNGPGGAVTIPAGVTSIGESAFVGSGLTSVTIPNSVTSIGESAFAGTNLTSVTIPNSVTSIGDFAFRYTPWLAGQGEFPIVNGILFAYQGSGGAVTIPNGVTSIGNSAFREFEDHRNSVTSVTIPNSVTSIGDRAFQDCESLTSITIPAGVTSIGDFAFSGTPWLTNQGEFPVVNGILLAYQGRGGAVTIPDSVTSIGNDAFWFCESLTSVTIPDGITSIGNDAFQFCGSLTSVTIPASVTSIGAGAFLGTSLTDVYYGGSEAQWKSIEIGDLNDPLPSATVHYSKTEDDTKPATPTQFTDVDPADYYAASVAWAVEKGITSGTTKTSFTPKRSCTETEIITFLWRAADKPASSAQLPFTVSGKWAFATEALAWAYEKGMIDDSFDADTYCTRYTAVSYIWKAFDSPTSQNEVSFTDIQGLDARPIAWALEKGITQGTNTAKTNFTPNRVCNRGEIVTFLFRAYSK